MRTIKKALICMILIFILTPASAMAEDIQFTAREKTFIASHPVINLAVDPEFVPYEFIDSDGRYKGIAADYIELLSQKIGLTLVVAEDLTWTEAYELAVEKKLDMMPCVGKTLSREKYFLFSDPYFEFQRVVVVKDTNSTIKNFSHLINTKVAVQTNSSHHSFLKSYPEIELSTYSEVEAALAAVANGTESAFVGNLATSSYLIKKDGFTNLKYVIINANEAQTLHFAVRNDWPELVSIINKGLESITEEEKIAINNKWIGVVNEIDYTLIIGIISMILIVLLVSVFWIIRLKREVSKRRIIEEQLKKAKLEAEVANQIKSSFLARMSHEIRTPLNAITGMAYLIKKTDITITQKMYLEKITQASYNMLGIINDILDFSKIESGKIDIEHISFNLDKVLQQVISIVSFKIEEQGINFTMDKDPEIPDSFFGDPKRIEQILINIINNAVKFTSEGEVSLGIRLIRKIENIYELEFHIQDTGIGMSEAQLTHLFTPFVQADSSINRRFGGTGLGLSIVKSLTDLMSGVIEVKSVPGDGSEFIITLPLELDQATENEFKQRRASLYFQDIKTLVLDKNHINLHLVQSYLNSFGMAVESSDSEAETMELLVAASRTEKWRPYDLLIMDYETPSEGAFEFVEKLRSNPILASTLRIILLIPFMREDIFEKIEETDIDLGITNPVIPSVLYNGILEMFRKETLELQEIKAQSMMGKKEEVKNAGFVLVVEDNKTNQFIAKSILEQAGFEVALADDGAAGVVYFTEHQAQIDLILMDLHMPILNGYEATAQIRKVNRDIPIVAMTADAITGVEEACKRVGIDHYISKPFDPEHFVDTLFDLLKPKKEPGSGNAVTSDSSDVNGDNLEKVLDEEDGLRRLGNNVDIYQMILKEYVIENKDVDSELEEAVNLHNYESAIHIVHKNKSGSGNIGAKKLYTTASQLQIALEQESETEVKLLSQEFTRLLGRVIKEIEERH